MRPVLLAIGTIALLVGVVFLLLAVALLISPGIAPDGLAATLGGGIGLSVGLSAILTAVFFLSFASVLGFLGRIARASETVERITRAGSQHPKRRATYDGVPYWVYEDDRVVAEINGAHQQFSDERELLTLLRARRQEAARTARPRRDDSRAPAPAAEDLRPEARPRAARP